MTNPPPLPNPPGRALHPCDELPPEAFKPAHAYAAQRDWPGYFAAVAGKPARETLLFALERFEREVGKWGSGEVGNKAQHATRDQSLFPTAPFPRSPTPATAIDLACGEGRDTAELLSRGWNVTAIDGHPEAIARIHARPDIPREARARLDVRFAMMEDAALPACDLLNASFALPFCEPAKFDALWARITASIRPGGRFAGQFFGERDDWASLPDRTHHTRAQVERLLAPFDIEMLNEEEKDGQDALQHPKHWHVFHVVARRHSARSEA